MKKTESAFQPLCHISPGDPDLSANSAGNGAMLKVKNYPTKDYFSFISCLPDAVSIDSNSQIHIP